MPKPAIGAEIEDLEHSIEIAEAINSPESVRAYTNLATVLLRVRRARRRPRGRDSFRF
jgi:hypothetical protein